MTEAIKSDKRLIYLLKAFLFCTVFTVAFIILSFSKSLVDNKFERIAHGIIGTVAAFLTTFLFVKFDKITFASIGLKFGNCTFRNFFFGVFIGIVLMGVLSLSVIFYSNFKVELNRNCTFLGFLLWTLPLIPLAFMEELGFRAYIMRMLKDQKGIRNSIIISSILFALYHVANGWTIQNSFLGAGVWGIVYGLAATYSNGISMPTGMHYAANLTTSAFGVSETSLNIWVLKSKEGLSLENYESSQWITIIPQISLLIFSLICMEWYLRNKTRLKSDT